MQYANIPGTDMRVSRLCLGTMTFGSPLAEADAVRLLLEARDELDINFIDTANMYEGYNRYAGSAGGVAEEIVGKAVSARRHDFIIATKVGMKVGQDPVDENTSPEAIRVQLRRSLKRLNTDYVDIYYLHRYDPFTAPEAIARAMGDELKAGTIRAWGVSNYTPDQLRALLAAAKQENIAPPALCQPALSLLNPGALDEMLPLCAANGIGVVPYQLLQGGLLTGKYRRNMPVPEGSRMAEKPEWMKPLTDESWAVIDSAAEAAAARGVSMTQYVMQWALEQPGVISALLGFKRREQIDEAAAAMV
ncbi:MAG: aldo/keto reductase [Clostridia bacterium]|nr:aldo/keto reductase [Clostridia bacterium]